MDARALAAMSPEELVKKHLRMKLTMSLSGSKEHMLTYADEAFGVAKRICTPVKDHGYEFGKVEIYMGFLAKDDKRIWSTDTTEDYLPADQFKAAVIERLSDDIYRAKVAKAISEREAEQLEAGKEGA